MNQIASVDLVDTGSQGFGSVMSMGVTLASPTRNVSRSMQAIAMRGVRHCLHRDPDTADGVYLTNATLRPSGDSNSQFHSIWLENRANPESLIAKLDPDR